MSEPIQLEFDLWTEMKLSYSDIRTGRGNELARLAQCRDMVMYDCPTSMCTVVRYRV